MVSGSTSEFAANPRVRELAFLKAEHNLEFLSRFDDESVQLVVTSPPYNIGKEYESAKPLDAYLDEQARLIRECVRVLKPGGSVCWQVGNHVAKGEVWPLDVELAPIFRRHEGMKLRNRIVWTFGHGLHCTRRFSGRHETILWFTKGDSYEFDLDPVRVPAKYPGKKHFKGPKAGQLSGNPKGKNPGDVWDIPNVKHNHPEKTSHPCQYPISLAERFVLSLTSPGDWVLDPHVGSGASVLAATLHDRRGAGCDLSEGYVEEARRKLDELAEGRLARRKLNAPIHSG